ncbi:MAG: citrate transporter, partial [Lachnospiraceae bacterium]|nr:citrate transporter [Lachnospiraceae bacterium]
MFAQILAVIIFVFMFGAIVQGKLERHWVTLGCGLATMVFVFGLGMRSSSALWETLNLHNIFTTEFWHVTGEATESSSGINWATIIFIAG